MARLIKRKKSKIAKVKLRSGSKTGPKIRGKKQSLSIALSEAGIIKKRKKK